MKRKISNMDDLNKVIHLLPFEVTVDINKRISDWIISGGRMTDGYIRQQFRYAERFIQEAEK